MGASAARAELDAAMRTFRETDIRRRTLVVSLLLTVWFALLAFRLVQLQVVQHAVLKGRALKQSQATVRIQARRGTIYDRNGKVLACSLPVFTVKLSPVDKETPAEEKEKVRRLQSVLGFSDKEGADILRSLRNEESFTYVKKKVAPEIAERVRELRIPGVGFDEESQRSYPLGSLAAQVLGGVNSDESVQAGVELRYNDILKGEDGLQIVFKDNKRRGYESQILKPPVAGRDIVLTIDTTLQYFTERALARAVGEHSASGGTIVMCDPSTGEILALANFPTYDVNRYTEAREAWLDRAIGRPYEPGSTFKIVTAAAALEKGVVDYSDVFDCSSGAINVGGLTIRDHEHMGLLTFPKVLIDSSNVGTVKFAMRLDRTDFYAAIKKFRFGERTGIDLPAEERGTVWPVESWHKAVSLPHIAIGYEISVTPLQILRAMNVYATRGWLVRPHVVKKSPDILETSALRPGPEQKILQEKMAEDLVDRVFVKVVEEGTARQGQLEGFSIAGKTGTAQQLDPVTKTYTSKRHTASFVGFVPAAQPALTMIVVLDDPKEGFYYGGQVCAPIFRDIARQALRYMGVAPDKPLPPAMITAALGREDRP
jgi:cell division protein FtsI/penicillin-binding protein 2